MFTEFKSRMEFERHFSNDSICRKYFEDLLWDGTPTCPHCGYKKAYKLKDGKRYRCVNKLCKNNFTITTGTVFENTKISLSQWFTAIWLVTNHKKGLSSITLAGELGIRQASAWFMIQRIYEMGITKQKKTVLKGEVMIDQTWHGGKMKNKSQSKRKASRELNGYGPTEDKIPVFGLVQRDGDTIMRVVPDEKSETLKPIIFEMVDKDTVIVSDGGVMHSGLDNDFRGHIVVNHSAGEYVNGPYTTNHIESVFAILKRTIYGIHHNVSPKHLQRYCIECGHRYNIRKLKNTTRFEVTLKNAAGRLKYDDLIGKK